MSRVIPIPNAPRASPVASPDSPKMPESDQPGDSAPEALMPYGAAAKAIFVEANGLPAYRKSIKFVRRAD